MKGMKSFLIAPIDNTILLGLCIDEDRTKVYEDMVRVTNGEDGSIQVDIAVIDPPVEKVRREDLRKALENLMVNSGKDIPYFIDYGIRKRYSFNIEIPQDAIVATYVVDSSGELIFEELTISRAVGIITPFSLYRNSEESSKVITALEKVIKTKPNVGTEVKHHVRRFLPESLDQGYLTTLLITKLFNNTCRVAARKKGVKSVFIKRPRILQGELFFRMNDGPASFNSSLRDPCSFINASNLSSYLSGKPPPFSKKILRKEIPVKEYS
jgi:hypothetical protein